jgi:HAMP domain-containing protein
MFLKPCFLALALTLAMPVFAQSAQPSDAGDCKAQEAALESDMDLARARGQMLRRRELADALSALQLRCKTPAPATSREARIEKLEQEIRTLRSELDRAEAQLRDLKNGSP